MLKSKSCVSDGNDLGAYVRAPRSLRSTKVAKRFLGGIPSEQLVKGLEHTFGHHYAHSALSFPTLNYSNTVAVTSYFVRLVLWFHNLGRPGGSS